MILSQPGVVSPPPAPPSPEAAARLRAENEALTAQLQNQALREATGALPGGPAGARARNVSVTKNAEGKVVVTTGDGRTVVYDPKVGLDEDAVQNLILTAIQPPRPAAEPWTKGPPESVAVVAIVFTFLLLITLVVSVARVLGKRVAAGAGAQHLPPDVAPRLARIEQAIEAVAIEVERVSEAQRYSARLLTERLPQPAAPGLGAASPTADVVR